MRVNGVRPRRDVVCCSVATGLGSTAGSRRSDNGRLGEVSRGQPRPPRRGELAIGASFKQQVPEAATATGQAHHLVGQVEGNYPSTGSSGERAAWFRDSEGNLLAIGQPTR